MEGDGPSTWRSCEHTDLLVETLDLGVLWDEYGIVGDIVVCFFLSGSHSYGTHKGTRLKP